MKINIPSVKKIITSSDEEGQRIFNFLYTKFKGVPKSMIYRILRKGEVRINKRRVQPKYKLTYGDEIRIPPIREVQCKEETISPYLKKFQYFVR